MDKVENEHIRWIHPPKPVEAVASIRLNEKLSTEELTLKWKKLAIILPIISTIATALITGFISIYISRNSSSSITKTREPILLNVGGPIYADCGKVRIDGSATRANSTQENIKILWNWGDGKEDNQDFPAFHSYSHNDAYSVKLTVQGDTNQSETRAVVVNIGNAGQPNCR